LLPLRLAATPFLLAALNSVSESDVSSLPLLLLVEVGSSESSSSSLLLLLLLLPAAAWAAGLPGLLLPLLMAAEQPLLLGREDALLLETGWLRL
jgi:hypothetical protein